MGEGGPYRLDLLGWLQFERLCALAVEHEAGLADLAWHGHADRGRVALVDGPLALRRGRPLPGPVAVVAVWVSGRSGPPDLPLSLMTGLNAVPDWLGSWCENVLVLTNADATRLPASLRSRLPEVKRCRILGARALGESIDRHPQIRLALPSVLGLRDLAPLIDGPSRERSTLDLSAALDLAKVFWPTGAYQRARAVLGANRFVVLTGPPEMGKTAIARMLALALLTDGWEACECTTPEQLWGGFDRARRQVFVCDDAFGSTEYRPDSADRWARELGRILQVLDDRHWLIWTSRPAPLKAGLRRVHRERGSEHFPSPGEVLVDASALDLAEKTLILFRHAKHRGVGPDVRAALCRAGAAIVEHTHFTPERIRRLVAERLGELAAPHDSAARSLPAIIEAELARPTEAMARSFQALDIEHRELLTAMLDAPAGLIGERDLAAAARRHHSGGLSRPPGELIDRVTDHFLRVTPLGIDWVHPSWRDLVIDALRDDHRARQRFLSVCELHGALLAVSHAGGPMGTRTLPLLITDADWDALGDRVAALLGELDDHALARLLGGLQDARLAPLSAAQTIEMQSLAHYVLQAVCRRWTQQRRALPVFVLEAWFGLRARVTEPVAPPPLARTWETLRPAAELPVPLTARALAQLDDWLALAQLLHRHDPEALPAVDFNDDDRDFLGILAINLAHALDPDLRSVCESVLRRIAELAPQYASVVNATSRRLEHHAADTRWWVPEDIAAPPSSEPAREPRASFTRANIARVLKDL